MSAWMGVTSIHPLCRSYFAFGVISVSYQSHKTLQFVIWCQATEAMWSVHQAWLPSWLFMSQALNTAWITTWQMIWPCSPRDGLDRMKQAALVAISSELWTDCGRKCVLSWQLMGKSRLLWGHLPFAGLGTATWDITLTEPGHHRGLSSLWVQVRCIWW